MKTKIPSDRLGHHRQTLLLPIFGSHGSEGLRRNPLRGGTRSRLLHHLIDLLEGQALSLGDEEVGVDEGAGAETTPDEEDGGLQVSVLHADHVWGNDGNDLSVV
jgi:hypothetical protein